MTQWFQQEWIQQHQSRDEDEREPVAKIAEMTWKLEDKLLEEAGLLWPRAQTRDHAVMFELEDRQWLHWQAILRRQAWLTLLQTRDTMTQKHLAAGAKQRVITQVHKGDSIRMTNGTLWKQADGLELLLRTWHRYTQWHQLDRRIQSRTRRCIDKWENTIAQDIERARKQKDDRTMWQKMRILGRTGHRSRKRNIRDTQREDPTVQEWIQAMSKPGKHGGCTATKVETDLADGSYDRKRLIHLEDPGTPDLVRSFRLMSLIRSRK